MLGLGGIVTSALRTSIAILPVTVLIGTIIGVLDLQARREMTIIKATGASIWRIVRAPLVAAMLLGLFAGLCRPRAPCWKPTATSIWGTATAAPGSGSSRSGSDGAYILAADRARAFGTALDGVTVFFTGATHDRIDAPIGEPERRWRLGVDRRHALSARRGRQSRLPTYRIPTDTSVGDMRVKLTSARESDAAELLAARSAPGSPIRTCAPGALTNLYRLLVLPALLVGSVLIGFAFTSGYRRTNKYGGTVLYGIVLGFVVYVVTELATRSGVAGVRGSRVCRRRAGICGDCHWADSAALQGRRAGVMVDARPQRPDALPRARRCAVRVLAAIRRCCPCSAAARASATLLPPGFFDVPGQIGKGPAAVEADRLNYDAKHSVDLGRGQRRTLPTAATSSGRPDRLRPDDRRPHRRPATS